MFLTFDKWLLEKINSKQIRSILAPLKLDEQNRVIINWIKYRLSILAEEKLLLMDVGNEASYTEFINKYKIAFYKIQVEYERNNPYRIFSELYFWLAQCFIDAPVQLAQILECQQQLPPTISSPYDVEPSFLGLLNVVEMAPKISLPEKEELLMRLFLGLKEYVRATFNIIKIDDWFADMFGEKLQQLGLEARLKMLEENLDIFTEAKVGSIANRRFSLTLGTFPAHYNINMMLGDLYRSEILMHEKKIDTKIFKSLTGNSEAIVRLMAMVSLFTDMSEKQAVNNYPQKLSEIIKIYCQQMEYIVHGDFQPLLIFILKDLYADIDSSYENSKLAKISSNRKLNFVVENDESFLEITTVYHNNITAYGNGSNDFAYRHLEATILTRYQIFPFGMMLIKVEVNGRHASLIKKMLQEFKDFQAEGDVYHQGLVKSLIESDKNLPFSPLYFGVDKAIFLIQRQTPEIKVSLKKIKHLLLEIKCTANELEQKKKIKFVRTSLFQLLHEQGDFLYRNNSAQNLHVVQMVEALVWLSFNLSAWGIFLQPAEEVLASEEMSADSAAETNPPVQVAGSKDSFALIHHKCAAILKLLEKKLSEAKEKMPPIIFVSRCQNIVAQLFSEEWCYTTSNTTSLADIVNSVMSEILNEFEREKPLSASEQAVWMGAHTPLTLMRETTKCVKEVQAQVWTILTENPPPSFMETLLCQSRASSTSATNPLPISRDGFLRDVDAAYRECLFPYVQSIARVLNYQFAKVLAVRALFEILTDFALKHPENPSWSVLVIWIANQLPREYRFRENLNISKPLMNILAIWQTLFALVYGEETVEKVAQSSLQEKRGPTLEEEHKEYKARLAALMLEVKQIAYAPSEVMATSPIIMGVKKEVLAEGKASHIFSPETSVANSKILLLFLLKEFYTCFYREECRIFRHLQATDKATRHSLLFSSSKKSCSSTLKKFTEEFKAVVESLRLSMEESPVLKSEEVTFFFEQVGAIQVDSAVLPRKSAVVITPQSGQQSGLGGAEDGQASAASSPSALALNAAVLPEEHQNVAASGDAAAAQGEPAEQGASSREVSFNPLHWLGIGKK